MLQKCKSCEDFDHVLRNYKIMVTMNKVTFFTSAVLWALSILTEFAQTVFMDSEKAKALSQDHLVFYLASVATLFFFGWFVSTLLFKHKTYCLFQDNDQQLHCHANEPKVLRREDGYYTWTTDGLYRANGIELPADYFHVNGYVVWVRFTGFLLFSPLCEVFNADPRTQKDGAHFEIIRMTKQGQVEMKPRSCDDSITTAITSALTLMKIVEAGCGSLAWLILHQSDLAKRLPECEKSRNWWWIECTRHIDLNLALVTGIREISTWINSSRDATKSKVGAEANRRLVALLDQQPKCEDTPHQTTMSITLAAEAPTPEQISERDPRSPRSR